MPSPQASTRVPNARHCLCPRCVPIVLCILLACAACGQAAPTKAPRAAATATLNATPPEAPTRAPSATPRPSETPAPSPSPSPVAATATATQTPEPLSTATDTPPPAPTIADTSTPAPTATDTETPAPTVTATPAAPVYNAAYVADVTIPDGTSLAPGEPFTKTWRLRNTGDAPWDEGTALVLAEGEAMGAPERVTVPPTAPGETADVEVPMVAPEEAGTHRASWRLCRGADCFGGAVAVLIVSQAPAVAPARGGELPAAVEGCPYIGNSNTGKFHHSGCSSVDDMREEHKVCLQTREEGIAQGFVPCKRCDP